MHLEVDATPLWFDVDGSALAPDGPAMVERPTVIVLHGGPGSLDHPYFNPDFASLTAGERPNPSASAGRVTSRART